MTNNSRSIARSFNAAMGCALIGPLSSFGLHLLYSLVRRLDCISARMKRMLKIPSTNWKRNIYTSRFVEQYMDETSHLYKKIDKL